MISSVFLDSNEARPALIFAALSRADSVLPLRNPACALLTVSSAPAPPLIPPPSTPLPPSLLLLLQRVFISNKSSSCQSALNICHFSPCGGSIMALAEYMRISPLRGFASDFSDVRLWCTGSGTWTIPPSIGCCGLPWKLLSSRSTRRHSFPYS